MAVTSYLHQVMLEWMDSGDGIRQLPSRGSPSEICPLMRMQCPMCTGGTSTVGGGSRSSHETCQVHPHVLTTQRTVVMDALETQGEGEIRWSRDFPWLFAGCFLSFKETQEFEASLDCLFGLHFCQLDQQHRQSVT